VGIGWGGFHYLDRAVNVIRSDAGLRINIRLTTYAPTKHVYPAI
jgi:hypothetical protein